MSALTLINAQVHTMDPGCPRGSGLIIQDGRITQVIPEGNPEVAANSGKVLDLGGRVLVPGLIDSHLHLRTYAESLQKMDCETATRAACLDRVSERVQGTPPGSWILGHGWNHNLWPEGYGSAADLDRISRDHPIYLTGKSLHVSWANSLALELAGITPATPDPPGGMLGRDGNGSLTGILYEEAVKLVEARIPLPEISEIAAAIQASQSQLWRLGLTGVHDFDRLPCLEALQLLESRGTLKLRVQKSVPAESLDAALERGWRTGQGSEWLWFGGVKDFMDGALGPQTAALLEPYQGSDGRGMLLRSEEEIYQLGRRAAAGGLALSIHAIGDRAIRSLLDAFQRLRDDEIRAGRSPLPHRIEHLQLIDPHDIPRLAELGLTASMQPFHATSDMVMAEAYWGERTRYAYAPKYQLDHNARVIFGSDAPVEEPNPWLGIHAAVTRRALDGSPGPDGWHPEGRISPEQALRSFTAAPGESCGRGSRQGKLIPGSWADLVLLAQDPLTCSPDSLAEIEPAGTMIAGEWVWREFD